MHHHISSSPVHFRSTLILKQDIVIGLNRPINLRNAHIAADRQLWHRNRLIPHRSTEYAHLLLGLSRDRQHVFEQWGMGQIDDLGSVSSG